MTAPISAVIPCHNSMKTLERAVKSVVQQSHRPAELFLVDDGSTDTTVEFMHVLQKRYGDDWIKVIELGHNLGVSTARNTGWKHATQKYVAFLDSDDAWHKDKIYIQYTVMEKYSNYVLSGHHYSVVNKCSEDIDLKTNYKIEEYGFMRQLFKNYFVTPSVMIRRDCRIKFQTGKHYMEDHLFLLEIANEYGPALKIQLPLTFLFKAEWGESGLSSKLWAMENGNLNNFLYLYKRGFIKLPLCLTLLALSLLRFQRRLIIKLFT